MSDKEDIKYERLCKAVAYLKFETLEPFQTKLEKSEARDVSDWSKTSWRIIIGRESLENCMREVPPAKELKEECKEECKEEFKEELKEEFDEFMKRLEEFLGKGDRLYAPYQKKGGQMAPEEIAILVPLGKETLEALQKLEICLGAHKPKSTPAKA